MKLLLLSIIIMGCSAVLAQDLPKKNFRGALPGDRLIKLNKGKKPVDVRRLLMNSNKLSLQRMITTANGTKLMILPQDNMPCVVPDMSLYRMPNSGVGYKVMPGQPGIIPNPGLKIEDKNTQ